MFETTIRDGVLQAAAPEARWLSTAWNGGYQDADAAYNISVPEGWDRQDLDAYVNERIGKAGFGSFGPALLTGVNMEHAVGARLDSVTALVTVGLSNPASLPLHPGSTETAKQIGPTHEDQSPDPGTINILLGTERALKDGALATLLGAVVEAKAGTLQQLTGYTGTTSDAVIVATNPGGEPSDFAGSSTPIGSAARAVVRDAIVAGIEARDAEIPASVAAADSGIKTAETATVFEL